MPAKIELDFDTLAGPLSGDRPTGVYLREDKASMADYSKLRSERGLAIEAENWIKPTVDLGTGDRPPDPVEAWRKVLERAGTMLEVKTKDLEIASHLLDALTRLHGAEGLRFGLRLMKEYVTRYWDADLYPPPDTDYDPADVASYMEPRLRQVVYLTQTRLLDALDKLPLTDPLKDMEPATFLTHEEAFAAEYPREGVPKDPSKMERLKKRVAAELPYVRTVVADLRGANEELSALAAGLTAKVGEAAPSVSKMADKIKQCVELVSNICPEAVEVPTVAPVTVTGTTDGSIVVTPIGPSQPVVGREEALRELERIAAYFKELEPHSPVSYHVERAVRWGRMSLPDLLKELIGPETLGVVSDRIGIRPAD